LKLYGTIHVGKDKLQWQGLECYLFGEMLICVKEKKATPLQQWSDEGNGRRTSRCTLKGSILIKKHLNGVTQTSAGDTIGMTQRITSQNLRPQDENILALNLSVPELPQFYLQFDSLTQLKLWEQALIDLQAAEESPMQMQSPDYERDLETEEEDWRRLQSNGKRVSSVNSSSYAGRSTTTAPTEYTNHRSIRLPAAIHVPVDIVVVVPISSSMQGVKITLVRDALNYMVQNLGERDRMGLVTFGSSGGGVPLVGMTTKTWSGWQNILSQIKPVGQKLHRADVVEGANVAMDLLMQRKANNPVATILLISDSSTSDPESVDFVVSRAEAAK
jgi:Mg-chelatase subunit ChlD